MVEIQEKIHAEKFTSSLLIRFAQICAVCVPNIGSTNSVVPGWYIFYSIGIITIDSCLCIWTIFNKWNKYWKYSTLSAFVFDILTTGTLTSMTVLIIINAVFLKEKRIRKLLEELTKMHVLFVGENLKITQKQKKIAVFELVAVHLVLINLYAYDLFSNGITFGWNYYTFDVPNFINEYLLAIEVLYICSYTFIIKNKMLNLRTSLIHLTNSSLHNFPDDTPFNNVLQKCFNAHNKLCNLIDEFNECFGLPIFGILVVGVIYTTYTIFLLLIYGSGSVVPQNNVSVIYILILYSYQSLLYMV